MLLKRKRSDDELSCLSGGGIGFSSPMRSDNGDIVMMDTESPISPRTMINPLSPSVQNRSRSGTPSHLPSRTFKRLRNGRPSEEEVHQNTLKLLYQAQAQQQQRPHHEFSPPAIADSIPTMPSVAPSSQSSPFQNQPSLHNFWKLPSAQPPSQLSTTPTTVSTNSSPPTPGLVNRATACEDCGVALSEEDAMMDDGYGFETYINTCSACARAVCFSCSVSNLGEQRRCLLCAGKERVTTGTNKNNQRLTDGRGWTFGGLPVC